MPAFTVEEIRAILDGYTEHCDPGCPGWIISYSDSRGLEVEVCDDCTHDNDSPLTDDDVALLPEAQAALIIALNSND